MNQSYSQTYIATIVSILAVVLPHIGVKVSSEEITSIVQSLVVVIMGVWILVRRYKQGGVTPLGVKK